MIASSVVVANKKFSEQENANPAETNSQPAQAVGKQSAELAPEEKRRGKRMMGVLMGTLSKFKSEEVDKSEATLKKILLEQKLAQKLQEAKTDLAESKTTDITMAGSRRVVYPPSTTDAIQRTETAPVLFFKRAA